MVNKTNKQKLSIFKSQTIYNRTTTNSYNKQMFTPKKKLNKTKNFGDIKTRSRLVAQSVATIQFSCQT